MSNSIRIFIDNATGISTELTVWTKVVWSGNKKSCARTATVTLLCDSEGASLPIPEISLGAHCSICEGDSCLLDGFISSAQKSTGSSLQTFRVHDRGLYLNQNTATFDFRNATPYAAVVRICTSFGISIGEIAETGFFRLTRKFVGVSLYNILATFFTKAAEFTGVGYSLGFVGERFCVRKLQLREKSPIVQPGSNLLKADIAASSEAIYNRVVVLDSSESPLLTKFDADSQAQFGVRQLTVKGDGDPDSQARALLENHRSPTEQLSVTVLGDTRLTSGEAVVVKEPATGLDGVFFITSDTHTWEKGIYSTTIVLERKNTMSKVDVGT